MNLLDRVKATLNGFVIDAGVYWHSSLEPWFENLLKTVVHAEVDLLIPLARQAAADVIADVGTATTFQGFLNSAGEIAVRTANAAKDQGLRVAGTSLLTAVTAAIAEHPQVVLEHDTVAPVTLLDEASDGRPSDTEEPVSSDSDSLGNGPGQAAP